MAQSLLHPQRMAFQRPELTKPLSAANTHSNISKRTSRYAKGGLLDFFITTFFSLMELHEVGSRGMSDLRRMLISDLISRRTRIDSMPFSTSSNSDYGLDVGLRNAAWSLARHLHLDIRIEPNSSVHSPKQEVLARLGSSENPRGSHLSLHSPVSITPPHDGSLSLCSDLLVLEFDLYFTVVHLVDSSTKDSLTSCC